ncbi:MAG: class I SAM-dependent methyltransferase [Candidatus Colwellbacteria bacterium]|nr:class I SAM-dependent methyltransferase [Candidatus Colwellbacteria bacterium]
MKKDTSWGRVAGWYGEKTGEEKGYQQSLILPNALRMIGAKKGEIILDLACGEGFISRRLSDLGADVYGVDISPELIAMARKRAPKAKFSVSPAEDMNYFENGFFDKAIMALAAQNIDDFPAAMKECSRVMRKGGRLILILNHPCFRIPKNSSWGFDDQSGIQYRRIDRYLSETREEIDMYPGSDKKEVTFSFHRPLQYYLKIFSKSGFCVSRLEEWNSGKTSQPGKRAAAENRARKEIPLFMALECVKMS